MACALGSVLCLPIARREGLAQFLLRAESVGSSKIEGLEAAARRLARAEAAIALGGDANDRVPVEVIGNIAAMESAVELATSADPFELEDLLSVHRALMDNSSTPELGGVVREEQNWIGGSSFYPCSAAFVPPPHEYLDDLLADLLDYVNGDEHSPSSKPQSRMPSSRPSTPSRTERSHRQSADPCRAATPGPRPELRAADQPRTSHVVR